MGHRIAVFGGSCNPFANHHQEILRWLVGGAGFPLVLVVPAVAHAFKRDLVPFEHRYNMALLGVEDLRREYTGDARIEVSTVEVDLLRTQPTPIRTYEVLCSFRESYPDKKIQFVIGPDIIEELPRWANVSKIEQEFGFVQVPAHIPKVPARSTMIRDLISANDASWRSFVPGPVEHYIDNHGLYRSRRLF